MGVRLTNIQRLKINCPHYLSQLNLTRGGIATKNYKIVNNKKIYGSFEVRMFEYLSIKFDFTPSFVQGSFGRYNAENGSFVGGTFGKVRKFPF